MTTFEDALCRQSDPELWFPERGGDAAAKVAAAKRICGVCPARRACAQAALDVRAEYGVWAGVSVSRHADVRVELARIAAGVPKAVAS